MIEISFQVQLVENCYDNGVQTVGIAGSSTQIVSSFDKPTAVILVDDASRATTTPGPGTRETRYKLQNFVVKVSSIPRLEQTLKNLKTSLWWNHMAFFLIVDESSPHGQGCSNAYEILSTAWKMNLLRAKFICHDESKELLIYSYNPYTNQAPLPWQLVKTYRIKNKHPWTLAVRSYQDSQEICKDLDFDKTKDLGGYEIPASVLPEYIDSNATKTTIDSMITTYAVIAQYLLRALNSTSKVFVTKDSKPTEMTHRGVTDILLIPLALQNDFNPSIAYPHAFTKLVSVTQHRGNLSQIGKLLNVIDNYSRYAVVIVSFVTFLFFKFFARQTVTSAFLSIVRMICNAAVPNLPNNLATRIYFSGLFVFVVTLQAIYQGQLASLLTKQVALPNVDTLEDLENFNYTVYSHVSLVPLIEKLNFSGQIVPTKEFRCEKYVLKDKNAACVNFWFFVVGTAARLNLHVADGNLMTTHLAYVIRDDWPLEERFNTITSRFTESNIIPYVSTWSPRLEANKVKFSEEEKDKQKFKVITLEELAFAFAILGIGLALSMIVFIVEILTK